MNDLPLEDIKIHHYQNGMGQNHHVRYIHLPTGWIGEGRHETSYVQASREAAAQLAARLADYDYGDPNT